MGRRPEGELPSQDTEFNDYPHFHSKTRMRCASSVSMFFFSVWESGQRYSGRGDDKREKGSESLSPKLIILRSQRIQTIKQASRHLSLF